MRKLPYYPRRISFEKHSRVDYRVSEYLFIEESSIIPPYVFKESPGKGFRHFVTKKDLISFIELLPEWNALSFGIEKIVLAKGDPGCDGWYDGTSIGISAWERDQWRMLQPEYYLTHKYLFSRLQVECSKQGKEYLCKFTPKSIRAFQLLHVFLHELGHHFDKLATRRKQVASRGERYAESYAFRYEELIWQRYCEKFDY